MAGPRDPAGRYDSSVAPTDVAQSLMNLKLERDAIALYDALAAIEKDERRARAFGTIAGNERRHAGIWAAKLREQGADVPEPGAPRLRVRFIILVARLFGTHAVSDLVQALEGDEEETYDAQASPEVAAIAADEREHAEIWKRLGAPKRRPRGRQYGCIRAVATAGRRAGTGRASRAPSGRSSSG
jgi:rubrerythrin